MSRNSIVFRLIRKVCDVLVYTVRKRYYLQIDKTSYVSLSNDITPQYLSLGKHTWINKGCRIEGVSRYNDKLFYPRIVIEDYVTIQQNMHLTCANSVRIGAYSAIAANVTITDIHHPYSDVNTPIERQDIEVKEVVIGSDCKIYNGVVILPGVTIGHHVTVGANSVVSHDLPDYCVAVGTPARIVKRYDFDRKAWRNTHPNGDFKE